MTLIRPAGSILAISFFFMLTACADQPDGTGEVTAADADTLATRDCEPLETRPREAPAQEPAFPWQTRACADSAGVAFEVEVVARGLEHPWAVEPLPDGDLLVTERPGRLRIVTAAGEIGEPISGVPDVHARGQGGLLDIALSPDFGSDATIFLSYAQPRQGGNGTAVARATLSDDRTALENVEVIFQAEPTYDGDLHFGSRLAFGPDGMLYITTGDRSDAHMREHAQRLDGHMGKTLRIAPDGSVPDDNPFVGTEGARPEIWSLGHRNIQSAAFDAQGRYWEIEHGTRGGDELNLVEKGKNYGWPDQAYGIEYSGRELPGEPQVEGADFEQPVYYWDPVIAPSGAEFYSGSAFPEWQGDLFIGALRDMRLVRIRIEGERVVGEEHLLRDRNQRIRDVREGPDGALYIVTDNANGELWRIVPAAQARP